MLQRWVTVFLRLIWGFVLDLVTSTLLSSDDELRVRRFRKKPEPKTDTKNPNKTDITHLPLWAAFGSS